MSVFVFNEQLAIRVFSELARKWELREPPFDTMIPPEVKHHPSNVPLGGVLHALMIFFHAFLQRFGKKADVIARSAKLIVEEYPWLLDPESPEKISREQFDVLRDVIVFADVDKYAGRVDWWINALSKIRLEYGGDPRNIILYHSNSCDPVVNRDQVINALLQFEGIGGKIAQLTVGWLQETKWNDMDDRWEAVKELPVQAADLWVMRLFRQLELITEYSTDQHTALEPVISAFSSRICHENNISHTDLIQALWHVGAKVCGTLKPKSARYRSFCHGVCPVKQYCKGIVPANYIPKGELTAKRAKNGRIAKARRISSMRFGMFVPHEQTFDDMWDTSL